jgi:STE24 endopeptidase
MAGKSPLVAAVVAITGVIDLPFDYIRQFVIEERFGFNRMTKKLFFFDLHQRRRCWARQSACRCCS